MGGFQKMITSRPPDSFPLALPFSLKRHLFVSINSGIIFGWFLVRHFSAPPPAPAPPSVPTTIKSRQHRTHETSGYTQTHTISDRSSRSDFHWKDDETPIALLFFIITLFRRPSRYSISLDSITDGNVFLPVSSWTWSQENERLGHLGERFPLPLFGILEFFSFRMSRALFIHLMRRHRNFNLWPPSIGGC